MVETPCRSRRHLEAEFVIGLELDAMWYQAGSCALSSMDMQMAARLVWYILAVWSIQVMLLFSHLAQVSCLAASHVWRKGFFLARFIVTGRAVADNIRSVMVAYSGCEGEKFRYDFNHMISMASLCAFKSRRLIISVLSPTQSNLEKLGLA